MKRNKDEIIELLSKGYTAAAIGKKLKISPRTVEVHILGLKVIYGAKNTTHLVALWMHEKYSDENQKKVS